DHAARGNAIGFDEEGAQEEKDEDGAADALDVLPEGVAPPPVGLGAASGRDHVDGRFLLFLGGLLCRCHDGARDRCRASAVVRRRTPSRTGVRAALTRSRPSPGARVNLTTTAAQEGFQRPRGAPPWSAPLATRLVGAAI